MYALPFPFTVLHSCSETNSHPRNGPNHDTHTGSSNLLCKSGRKRDERETDRFLCLPSRSDTTASPSLLHKGFPYAMLLIQNDNFRGHLTHNVPKKIVT